MIKEIELSNKKIYYELTYKRVKNINLRIKPDGTVSVSANKWTSQNEIDRFLISKEKLILNALEKFKAASSIEQKKYFNESEIKDVVLEICNMVYPYYKLRGINYPEIKFRKMVSRWGSCHPKKKVLTFNINLMYALKECIEYVVHHEFTHFLVPNHSSGFYNELEKVCPNWKNRRKILKEIVLKKN